jgi:hypothetical protein
LIFINKVQRRKSCIPAPEQVCNPPFLLLEVNGSPWFSSKQNKKSLPRTSREGFFTPFRIASKAIMRSYSALLGKRKCGCDAVARKQTMRSYSALLCERKCGRSAIEPFYYGLRFESDEKYKEPSRKAGRLFVYTIQDWLATGKCSHTRRCFVNVKAVVAQTNHDIVVGLRFSSIQNKKASSQRGKGFFTPFRIRT